MDKFLSKKKLVKDISANMLQTVTTQLFGLLIFYITSKYLSKNDFGEFNWSTAVGFTVIAVASLGLDLVFVKRVASGESVLEISGIHYFHTVIVGVIITGISLLITLLVPSFSIRHPLFFFILLNVAIINIANSFKLCLNGLDAYKQLAILALCTNVFKLLSILSLFLVDRFNVMNVIIMFLTTSVLEFVLAYFLMNKVIKARVKPLLKVAEYKYFILESLPQLGVVVFDSALSRMDLILLGLISTAGITAEYSFVYKVYELSKLPLIIIGPVLLTRFSKLFSHNKQLEENQKNEIAMFFRLELFIMMLIPIFLISVWSPLVDFFTNNKYGAVNETNYWILSACVPMVCIVNFLWTLGFVQGQLKAIMYITMAVSALNIVANLILIPAYGGFGSAIAFLISTLVQVGLYLRFINQSHIKFNFKSAALTFMNAGMAIILGKLWVNNIIFTTVNSIGLYVVLSIITKQINLKHVKQLVLGK